MSTSLQRSTAQAANRLAAPAPFAWALEAHTNWALATIVYAGQPEATALMASAASHVDALLDRTGVLRVLKTPGRCYATAQVAALVEQALPEGGEEVVQQIEGWTHAERCRNDARLFAGCAERLASGPVPTQ